jgi:predicted AlkP superfamily phosphohydrolase/phosphomutase
MSVVREARRTSRADLLVQKGLVRRALALIGLTLAVLLAHPTVASAYIGPGAGFALVSSFVGLLAAALLALVALVRWPFRLLWRLAFGPRRRAAGIRRLIIVGFDGQSPILTDRWLADGQLPHFAALAAQGCYHRLRTTTPPVSPVAWSSFATGTNPGRHGIFDFLDRDPRTYAPRLSSTRIDPPLRTWRLGAWRIPLGRPRLQQLRGSQPFWTLLGRGGVWSTILRVPVSFPPDRFHGAQLSAMAAPDLLGTQGTFILYTTRESGQAFKEGGVRVTLTFAGPRAETQIEGPPNPFRGDDRPLVLAMDVVRDDRARAVTVRLGDTRLRLELGVLSDWVPLAFRAAPFVRVRGMCRMQLTELGEHVSIYVSPISLDPERPAMPISHPGYYAAYLAKKIGPFSTLGLAEDTWALNEGVIDDETFLRQTWDIDAERQRMFLAALDRLRDGTLACVFDGTDRVQHMFWRDLDTTHPAQRGGAARTPPAIAEQYRRNDAFLGEVRARLGQDDLLMVLSDHGFTSFRRGINLNRWLLDRGYLAVKPGGNASAEWLADVDWSKTRAYALGLAGLFLNVAGRERHGIVDRGAVDALKREIVAGLTGLRDAEAGVVGIRVVHDAAAIYDGPYVDRAPDLLVGYNDGYRVSWACASGVVEGPLFEDNRKPWSGDHCVDAELAPGVFFCSKPIATRNPALIDIAPTALTLFGLDVPPHIEGRSLFAQGGART